MSKSVNKRGGPNCCVPGCTSYYGKNANTLSFHRLPADDKRRAQWLAKIPRDWKAEGFKDPLRDVNQNSTYVCSRHFLHSEYSYSYLMDKRI